MKNKELPSPSLQPYLSIELYGIICIYLYADIQSTINKYPLLSGGGVIFS